MNGDQQRGRVVPPKFGALTIGFILFLGVWFGTDLDPDHPEMSRMMAVVVLMAFWWMTEAIPLSITALLPVVLYPFLGIMTGKDVSSLYVNHVVFLFIGGFIVALAIERWNLHQRIALRILGRFGTEPRHVLFGFMATTAFLSMWISNTATAMMMIPIAMSVIRQLGESSDRKTVEAYAKAIFLGIAYSASIGGTATLVGTPPNMVFVALYEQSVPGAPAISFVQWMMFALPFAIVFLAACWLVLVRSFRLTSLHVDEDPVFFARQYTNLGRMTKPERRVLCAAGLLGVLWIFRADINLGFATVPGWSRILNSTLGAGEYAHFVTDGTVAILIAILLFVVPAGDGTGAALMDWPTAAKLPWDIVLLFGGGFALAAGFNATGLTQWLGEQLHALAGLSPILIMACICLLATFLTEFTSNTGTTQIFLPVMVAVAAAIGVDPLMLMIPATLSCSCAFMLPVATPPNAIVFGSGQITVKDMSRIGIKLNLMGAALITLGVYTIGRWVFGF